MHDHHLGRLPRHHDRRAGPVTSATYVGEVVLVVNTASKCGLTPQYAGLQQLYDDYADQGLRRARLPVRPVRPPGARHRGRDRGVLRAATTASRFPMFAKIDVNGDDAHPLYQWLKDEQSGLLGGTIKWNFTKFLIGRDGRSSTASAPRRSPPSCADDIEEALAVEAEPAADRRRQLARLSVA